MHKGEERVMQWTKWAFVTALVFGTPVGAAVSSPGAHAAAAGRHSYVIQADVVLGSVGAPKGAAACVPNAVFFAGEHIDWRARIADAATGKQLSQAQIKQLGITVTVLLQGGPTVKMVYEAHPPAQAHPKKQSYYWVGPWAVTATYPMGPLLWTIKVQDKLGDTATFAPIGQDVGIPSIIIAPKH
jgi:hypothetical protein